MFVSRGVLQISAYVDTLLASLLPAGAVTALTNAQTLYTLPVSLFGMSVSAAELPRCRARAATSRRSPHTCAPGSTAACAASRSSSCRRRWRSSRSATSWRRRSSRPDASASADATYVWGILAGSAVGLLASTLGRLYASTYYALRDTRTPLRFAIVRVALTIALGWLCALRLPRFLGIDPRWGAAGLTASAGVAGWVEFVLLRATLGRRIGRTGLAASYLARLWLVAAVAAAATLGVQHGLQLTQPIVRAAVAASVFGAVYLLGTAALGVDESRALVSRVVARRR